MIKDKNNFLNSIYKMDEIILELGVGNRKRISSAIGIDILDGENVDIVGDATMVLKEIKSNSIDKIYSYHFLEHIDNYNNLLNETVRVLKKGGVITFVVPHFSNPFFFSDLTHKNFFGLYTFCYFAENNFFKRTFPKYSKISNLLLTDVKLIFKSYRPYYLRHFFKKIIQVIFNSTRYFQEIYEENFCYIFPCYEVVYKIKKK